MSRAFCVSLSVPSQPALAPGSGGRGHGSTLPAAPRGAKLAVGSDDPTSPRDPRDVSVAQKPMGQRRGEGVPADLPARSGKNSGVAAPFPPAPQDPTDPRTRVRPPVLGTGWHQGRFLADDPFQAPFGEPAHPLSPLQDGHPELSPHRGHDVEPDGSPAARHEQGQVGLLLLQAVRVQRTCNSPPCPGTLISDGPPRLWEGAGQVKDRARPGTARG